MKSFIKKWSWLILGILTVAILAGGANFGYNFMKDRADAQAKGIYEAKIAAAEKAKQAALKEKDALAEQAGKDREHMRLKAEAEKRKSDAAFAIFKSETAAELRKRQAKIEEVLTEKEKDEMAIVEAKDTIDSLANFGFLALFMWRLSDERIEVANKEAMDNLALQFVTCKQWAAKIEKKLKPTFLDRVKEYGKYAIAFGAGRLSAGL